VRTEITEEDFPLDTFEAIHGRRSIRQYKETPVPDDLLKKVLEAARWAPSWANSQCTRYVIVKDPATKEKLAETLNRGNPSTEAIKHAPIVVVACAELKKAGYYKGVVSTDRGDWFMFDVGIAMENLALAAQASGLGTVHVGFIPDSKKVDEILGLPEGVVSVEMTPLGFPAAESKAPPRKELSEIVFYEKYGKH
jgi:nitroreductase